MRFDQCEHQWETTEREVVVYTDTDGDTHYPDIQFTFCLKCSKQKQEYSESRKEALAEVLEKVESYYNDSYDPCLPTPDNTTTGVVCRDILDIIKQIGNNK